MNPLGDSMLSQTLVVPLQSFTACPQHDNMTLSQLVLAPRPAGNATFSCSILGVLKHDVDYIWWLLATDNSFIYTISVISYCCLIIKILPLYIIYVKHLQYRQSHYFVSKSSSCSSSPSTLISCLSLLHFKLVKIKFKFHTVRHMLAVNTHNKLMHHAWFETIRIHDLRSTIWSNEQENMIAHEALKG